MIRFQSSENPREPQEAEASRPRYAVVDEVETVEEVPPVLLLLKLSPSRLAGALAEIRSLPA